MPPRNSTCNLKNMFAHFERNFCHSRDFGYDLKESEDVKKKRNDNLKRRRDEKKTGHGNMKSLTVRAPEEAHHAIAFIAEQPVEVILGIAESLRLLKLEESQNKI